MTSSDPTTLSDVIRQQRDRIVARFVKATERDLSPADLPRTMLVDHIPSFLDEVAHQLETLHVVRSSQAATDASPIAREHGEQRWSLGFDLEAVIREYGVLQHCIVVTAKDLGVNPTIEDYDILAKCSTVGVAEAAAAYTKHRDEDVAAKQERLEFLSEAGEILSSSLDYRSTTSRLTRLVVPRMADWCAIHLEGVAAGDMPIAHVDPAKVALIRRLYAEFPSKTVPESYLEVLRTGEGRLVAQATPDFYELTAQSPEHLDLLRQLGTKSWVFVPLQVQQHTFGVLMIAYSESNRRYSEDDFVLATEVARRAATAIDNARLYELSQTERARVDAATRAKDEFVAMVSHELRTPLNAILGWLRMMRAGMTDETRRQHALEVIERNAETQDRLVADLLDISRVITGKIRLNPSQVDLCDLVDMAVETVRPAADAKRIRIDVELDRENGILRADAERLQQVVWNLIANAVKFTPKSGVVIVRLRRVDSDVELVVEDNGEGIEPSFIPHVFEIFQQYDRSWSRPHGGLGIGLSIVKHIVDLHGGTITAQSPGKGLGSTFAVRIPISPLISPTMGVPRVSAKVPTRDVPEISARANGLRALVVEDDPDARELVTVVLESSGIEVRSAATVAEGLALLDAYTPDVICSDIGLFDGDGYAFIRGVRALADPKKNSVPAIALTAFGRIEDRQRALVEGFNVHLTKPIEASTLVRTILDLVGRAT